MPGEDLFYKARKTILFFRQLECRKIQGTYFKISALYFKICALCFFLHPMSVKTGLESVEFFEGSGV